MVIVQGKHHMDSWYRERLTNRELVLLSESGFTSDTLTYRFLEHFIEHTHSSPNTPYKILLMDNHGSHLTPQFVLLARANNIVPFTFPAHLTHCMQPLDVGVFQSYKHWHNKAIQCALESLDFEYTISSFLRDLPEIRHKTFKKMTIQHAFSSSGMWPINRRKVAEKMAKYMKEPASKEKEPTLPTLPATPRTTKEFRTKWSELQPKIIDQLSSPTQRKFDSIQRGLHRILDDSDMTQIEKDMVYSRLSEVVRKKPTSRRRVQKGGELTAEHAQELIQAKDVLERAKWAKRVERAKRIKANKERRERHQAGVHARRIERLRKAELRKALEDDIGLAHLTIPIPDPETETQDIQEDTQETIPEGFEAGDPKNWLQEEVQDQVDHSKDWLQDDFVPFEEEDSSSDESFESFSSIIV
jgi:hypothetical protein